MLPTLVLVGRPNVGKSTLFNRLTASRAALVADFPGLTRDRQYGRGRGGDRPYLVVDTGGFEPKAKSGILHAMARQTRTAIAESDAVIFMVDGREGLTGQDRTIADLLRRSGRPVLLAVNKAEGLAAERVTAEFHELAMGEPVPISSAHGENVPDLIERALALCPAPSPRPRTRPEPRRSASRLRSSGVRTSASRRSSIRCSARIVCSPRRSPAPRATRSISISIAAMPRTR
jgi:GTP-binding protein